MEQAVLTLIHCASSLHRKMTPIFFSKFENVKILVQHFRQFLRWW